MTMLEQVDEIHVHVKAKQIWNNGNGTYTLIIEGMPLSEEQNKTLEVLFPTLYAKAEELLAQETLLASLATPADVNAKDRFGGTPPSVEVVPTRSK